MPKTIHVIFKTHLDIGFTGMGVDVLANYRDTFIPRAIAIAQETRASPHDISFIWTTGSWLIKHALEFGTPDQRAALDAAIRRGEISWHALPMSTQTELMDAELVDYGISISEVLDKRYGRTTKAAKMTDVPGHTIGLVPLLARRGIRYLHIGANPASAMPDVPSAFVWQAPDGSSILVNYDPNYGAAEVGRALEIDGCDSALYISHTNDNHGPQDVTEVIELFETLRRNYPGAIVKASTFEDFARDASAVFDRLPVITQEIGDTWIHGPASDPLHTARFRELLRLQRGWLADGRLVRGSTEYNSFNDPLLLIAEHTWGMDLKSFLPDFVNYRRDDFAGARQRDAIDPHLFPEEFGFLQKWTDGSPADAYTYSGYEASWVEQRNYIDRAIAALAAPLEQEARDAIARFEATPEALPLVAVDPSATYRLGMFSTRFGANGAIVSLIDDSGREWASVDHPIGAFWHETFGDLDYQGWFDDYCRDLDVNGDWAVPDFGKPGFEATVPSPARGRRTPRVKSFKIGSEDECDVAQLRLELPEDATALYGAPATVVARFRFDRERQRIEIRLHLGGRVAARLPEASWLTINPIVAEPSSWQMFKLGTQLSPLHVVENGNRNLHSVEMLSYNDDESSIRIEPLDSPVVGIGEARILEFDNHYGDLAQGFHLNLHNNVWGTNFRMWFDDDMTYRVRLSLEGTQSGAS